MQVIRVTFRLKTNKKKDHDIYIH